MTDYKYLEHVVAISKNSDSIKTLDVKMEQVLANYEKKSYKAKVTKNKNRETKLRHRM